MKLVILAGGLGSRLSEETETRPKPMVNIGGYPILWHIMKIYSHYGFNEFIVCLGVMSDIIKNYFYNYDESPLLIINTSSVDVNKPHDYSMLLQEINKEVKGKKYFNPSTLSN